MRRESIKKTADLALRALFLFFLGFFALEAFIDFFSGIAYATFLVTSLYSIVFYLPFFVLGIIALVVASIAFGFRRYTGMMPALAVFTADSWFVFFSGTLSPVWQAYQAKNPFVMNYVQNNIMCRVVSSTPSFGRHMIQRSTCGDSGPMWLHGDVFGLISLAIAVACLFLFQILESRGLISSMLNTGLVLSSILILFELGIFIWQNSAWSIQVTTYQGVIGIGQNAFTNANLFVDSIVSMCALFVGRLSSILMQRRRQALA